MLKINYTRSASYLEDGYWKWFKSYQLKSFNDHVLAHDDLKIIIFGSKRKYIKWHDSVLIKTKVGVVSKVVDIKKVPDKDLQNYRDFILCPPEKLFKMHTLTMKHVKSIKKCSADDYFLDRYSKIRKSETIRKLYKSEIDLKTCPYSNRSFIATARKRNGKLYLTFELDHFYSKSLNPVLAIVLYNLIPSCHTCNHLKLDSHKELLNPYLDSFEDKASFEFIDTAVIEQIINSGKVDKGDLVKISSDDTATQNSIDEFYLEELYKSHKEEAKELIIKNHVFNNSLIKEMKKMVFTPLGYSDEEIYTVLYASYNSHDNHHNRILSKFLNDLHKDLKDKIK